MPDIQSINFHGEPISTCRDERNGKVYCIPKEMSQRLGVNWSSQYAKLHKHRILSQGIVKITIPSPGGAQEVIALDVDLLPAWLFTFDLNKLDDAIAVKIEQYQKECASALRDYWFTGVAMNPRAADITPPQPLLSHDRITLLKESFAFLQELGMADDRDRLMFADIIRTTTRREFLPQEAGQPGTLALPAPQGFFVAERVQTLGYTLTRKQETVLVNKLARRIAAEYRSRYGEEPAKAQRYVDGAVRPVNWYQSEEASWADVLIQCFFAEHEDIHRMTTPEEP